MLPCPADSLKLRLAAIILVAIALTVGLRGLTMAFGGLLGNPPLESTGLPDQVRVVLRMVEAAPAEARSAMLAPLRAGPLSVVWYPSAEPPVPIPPLKPGELAPGEAYTRTLLDDPGRHVFAFSASAPAAAAPVLNADHAVSPRAYFSEIQLADGSWLLFTASVRVWGLGPVGRALVVLACIVIAVGLVSTAATRGLSRPVARFAEAAHRFGVDPQAQPIPETGPRELRRAAAAFNAMQARIQRFVADRTLMLAAISHDLRTLLTRMRLRGEFIDDPDQQARLFRDVDEMQAMIEAALAFFGDDARAEPTTSFDIAELLQSVVDDCADLGHAVQYSGPERATFRGRPAALKRAFANLVDNAVKYGRDPAIALSVATGQVAVAVTDRGPGIPADAREQVFRPFFRLDASRNRRTGGIGLGLATARSIVRAHGGDIALDDHGPGLAARVSLPAL